MTEVELLEHMLANVKQGLPAGRGILDRYMRPITDEHLAVIDLRGWRELSIQTDPALEEPMSATLEKEELTKEAFSARLYAESQGTFHPLWLCTHEEVKKSMLDDFDEAYLRWVNDELKQAARRESDRRSTSIEIIDLKNGESPWDYMKK